MGSFCIPGSVLNIQIHSKKIYIMYIDSHPQIRYDSEDTIVFSPTGECPLQIIPDNFARVKIKLGELSVHNEKWQCINLFEPGLSSGRSKN